MDKYMLIYIMNLEHSRVLVVRLITPVTCLAMTLVVT